MLAIAGGKGGCGKTTTTLGLAGALAQRGVDPLVVDGDCDMPDIHHRVELPRSNGVDGLADGQPLRDVVVQSERLPGVAIVTGGRRNSLEAALSQVSSWTGPVLVDCSAGTNRDSLRPLRHADRTVIVSTDQPQCIQDASMTRSIAGRLSASSAGVVLRRTSRKSGWGESRPTGVPEQWSCLARLPPVENPLDNRIIEDQFSRIAKVLFPDRRQNQPQVGEFYHRYCPDN
jgi:septum site-determining protein MinD